LETKSVEQNQPVIDQSIFYLIPPIGLLKNR